MQWCQKQDYKFCLFLISRMYIVYIRKYINQYFSCSIWNSMFQNCTDWFRTLKNIYTFYFQQAFGKMFQNFDLTFHDIQNNLRLRIEFKKSWEFNFTTFDKIYLCNLLTPDLLSPTYIATFYISTDIFSLFNIQEYNCQNNNDVYTLAMALP